MSTLHGPHFFNMLSLLLSKNRDLNKLKASILSQFPVEDVVYPSADFLELGDAKTEVDAETYSLDFLNQLEPKFSASTALL
jgi:hypothetical protein